MPEIPSAIMSVMSIKERIFNKSSGVSSNRDPIVEREITRGVVAFLGKIKERDEIIGGISNDVSYEQREEITKFLENGWGGGRR